MTPRLTLLVLAPLSINDVINRTGRMIANGGKAVWGLVSNPAQTVEKAAGDTILGVVGKAFGSAAEQVIKMSANMWASIPSFKVNAGDTLGGFVNIWMGLALLLGLIAALVKIAWQLRGEQVREVLLVMFNVAVAAALTGAVTNLLVSLGDRWCDFVLHSDLGTQSQANAVAWGKVVAQTVTGGGITNAPEGAAMTIILSMVLDFLLICGGLAQVLFMLFRNAVLPVMVLLTPVAIAGGATHSGRRWGNRMLSWLLAFVLYKPVAVLIYAVGMQMVFTDNKDSGQAQWSILEGTVLFVMIAMALPALVKLVAPLASAGGMESLSGAKVAGVAAGAAVVAGGAALAGGAGAAGAGSLGGSGAAEGSGAVGGGMAGGEGFTGADTAGGGAGGSRSGSGGRTASGGSSSGPAPVTSGDTATTGGGSGGAGTSEGDASSSGGDSSMEDTIDLSDAQDAFMSGSEDTLDLSNAQDASMPGAESTGGSSTGADSSSTSTASSASSAADPQTSGGGAGSSPQASGSQTPAGSQAPDGAPVASGASGSSAGRSWRDVRDAAYTASQIKALHEKPAALVQEMATDTEAGATGAEGI